MIKKEERILSCLFSFLFFHAFPPSSCYRNSQEIHPLLTTLLALNGSKVKKKLLLDSLVDSKLLGLYSMIKKKKRRTKERLNKRVSNRK